jgi:hypothetical protein
VTVALTAYELLAVMVAAALVAATDAARLSRLAMAYLATKLDVRPARIEATDPNNEDG